MLMLSIPQLSEGMKSIQSKRINPSIAIALALLLSHCRYKHLPHSLLVTSPTLRLVWGEKHGRISRQKRTGMNETSTFCLPGGLTEEFNVDGEGLKRLKLKQQEMDGAINH